MLTLIDALDIAPRHYRGKNDMKEYEFFECDWCGSICRMDIKFYKDECEPHIMSDTKYRCRECYDRMENRRPGRPKKEPTEAVTQAQQEDNATDHFIEVTQKVIDIINQPPHYTSGGVECIDAIMAAVEDLPPQEAVLVGNVIKYVWRYKRKNGKQDLQKAQWYLAKLIDGYNG